MLEKYQRPKPSRSHSARVGTWLGFAFGFGLGFGLGWVLGLGLGLEIGLGSGLACVCYPCSQCSC